MSMTTTNWYDGSKFVPGTPGVYQRRGTYGNVVFAKWTGAVWFLNCMSPRVAASQTNRSNFQQLAFRGLRDKP